MGQFLTVLLILAKRLGLFSHKGANEFEELQRSHDQKSPGQVPCSKSQLLVNPIQCLP